jgi:hypothetical protein
LYLTKRGRYGKGNSRKVLFCTLKKGGGMARETAERYYVVPEKKEGNGKGNGRKVLFCTLKKGEVWQGKQQKCIMLYLRKGGGEWQGKQQKGIILYLKKRGDMARETTDRFYVEP